MAIWQSPSAQAAQTLNSTSFHLARAAENKGAITEHQSRGLTQGGSVHSVGVSLVGRPIPDEGGHLDEGGLVGHLLGLLNGVPDAVQVGVAVLQGQVCKACVLWKSRFTKQASTVQSSVAQHTHDQGKEPVSQCYHSAQLVMT